MRKNDELHFETYEEAADWFETNDMTDYDLTPVEFDFDLRKNRNFFEVDHDLARQIRQTAKKEGISARVLVNKWLAQHLSVNTRSNHPST